MAETSYKVVETFTGGSISSTYVPADTEANALAVCVALFGGNHQVLEEVTTLATFEALATPVSYKRGKIMLKNDTTGDTTFLDLIFDITVKSTAIVTALQGKTINGVSADTVTVLSLNRTDVV